jgi:hypothetical protein
MTALEQVQEQDSKWAYVRQWRLANKEKVRGYSRKCWLKTDRDGHINDNTDVQYNLQQVLNFASVVCVVS